MTHGMRRKDANAENRAAWIRISGPSAGIVRTFAFAAMPAFIGWMALPMADLSEAQVRLERAVDRLESGMDEVKGGLDEIRSFLMRERQ